MNRVMVGLLGVLLAATAACSAEPEAAAETPETLSLYADGGVAESPLSRLGVPSTELKDALLVGPHASIGFTRTAVTAELTAGQLTAARVTLKDLDGMPATDQGVRAPDGHELLVVDAANPTAASLSDSYDISKIEYVLAVGGEKRPLGTSFGAYHLRDALLAVVPVGAEVRLEMTDEGRTQSLDLRTGKRVAAAAAFYPVREAAVAPSDGWRHRGTIHTSVEARISAKLSPWTKEKGWAPEGRAWLTGTVSVTVVSVEFRNPSKLVRTPAAITVDLGRDLTLSGSGVPAHLFPEGTSALAVETAFDPGLPETVENTAFTVEVPETLTGFKAVFKTDITEPGYARDAKFSHNSSEAELEARGS